MMTTALMLATALAAVSPDGRNEIRLDAGDGALRYSVLRDGKTLLKPAAIALAVRGKPFSAEVVSDEPFELKGELATPLYKKRSVSLAANGRRIALGGGYGIELVARDDGVAYRFTTSFPDAEVLVDGETAPIAFPSGDVSVWAGYPDVFPDADKTYSGLSNWEPVYTNLTSAAVGAKTDRMGVLPLVAEYADGTCLSVTESDQRDYPGWVFRGSGTAGLVEGWFPREPVEETCTGPYHIASVTRHDYLARTAGTRTYPWRLFQLAPCAAKLCEGDAVYALAEPCQLADTSWIRPGLAQWEWWHAWNLTGVDFRAGCNTATYLHYVDFAAEHGVPYVIMDGGWSKDYRLMNAKPAVDLKKIAAYAVAKDVGIILWSPWAAFIENREEMCRTYAEIGIRGFKLDGICRNDRYLTKYLEETARIAAKHRLVIDYHGVSKPSGLSRTYPNVLTFEGVHGLENTKWEGDWMPKCDFPRCDLTDYFCRMTAGPMDYTPGAMRNFASNEYHHSFSQPGSQGTRVRQLALFTLFESPLQMLCDSPSAYRKEAECFRFLSKVPTVWDETRGLLGRIGECAAVARRSGEVWYLGAMTDWTARELEIPTDFLKNGTWTAEIFEDGVNADRDATDYVRRERLVTAGEPLRARLAPGGGWTARLVRNRGANWYHPALYPYCDHAAGAGWAAKAQAVRFDNPEVNGLEAFREAVPVYHAQRKPPEAASGLATWRTLAENFLPGEPDAEILTKNPKPDLPLIVGFGGKRHVETYGGKIDLDKDEWRRWKAAHTNLLCCWTHIEWDNTVPLTYARAPKIADETRRREVQAFLGERPRTRYERVAVQRRFYDRMKDLYYGDDDVTGVMFASLFTGHVAAGFGAKTLIVETTNTSGRDAPEYRWNMAPMFCRGAARQFDLPWEWYVAVYMNGWTSTGEWWTNAECVYPWSADAEIVQREGYHPGPEHGVSRSLQRRAYYLAYLSGANLVEQEEWSANFLRWDKARGKTVLTPRGEDFVRYHAFTKRHPGRGEAYAPVAILVPYAQGYPTYGGCPWAAGDYGYTAGDQAIDSIFFTLAPGFDRTTALKKGVETNLHNSPYAAMYDVLTPDAPQDPFDLLAALDAYRAVVLAGDYPDRGFEKTLSEYARRGGRVIRIGADEVPYGGTKAISEYQNGRRRDPAVVRVFDALQDEFCPVKVSGDCLYGLNRTPSGWWLWTFNNRGVTKFADAPETIDASAAVTVTVDLRGLRPSRVTELLSDRAVEVKDGRFAFTVPAGDLAVFELETEGK